MDKKIFTLWKNCQYPFNQVTLHFDELIELNMLHNFLKVISDYLMSKFNSQQIHLNHDWHEHDGFISSSVMITWNDYFCFLSDEKSLYNSRDKNCYVRITIYPENVEFILRYYILEDYEYEQHLGIWGEFDLTIDTKYLGDIINLVDKTGVRYVTSNPKEYYDKNYGG